MPPRRRSARLSVTGAARHARGGRRRGSGVVQPAILTNLDVDELDRALAFYTRLLGVKVGRRFGELGIELIGESAPIYLLAKAAGSPASPSTADRRRYDRHWTP